MEISELMGTIIGGVTILGFVIGGLGVLLYVFDKAFRARKKQKEETSENLIKLLNETIAELNRRVGELEKDSQNKADRIQKLEERNKTLLEVLQGRDDQSQKMYAHMERVLHLTAESNATVDKTYKMLHKKLGTNPV